MARLAAVGDVMLGRGLAARCDGEPTELIDPSVGKLMSSATIVTGNLECLITERQPSNPYSHSAFATRISCAKAVLDEFDVVSLANNHVHDYGDPGIDDTLAALRDLGVAPVGIGRDWKEASAPACVDRGELSVAIFGLTTVGNPNSRRALFQTAAPTKPALARIHEMALSSDLVVVHLHAGHGDVRHPSPEVRRLHQLIRAAGADVVLGHHPHVVQAWEQVDDRVSFYSLGDFIFDKRDERRRWGAIALVDFDRQGLEGSLVPTIKTSNLVVTLPAAQDRAAFEDDMGFLQESLREGHSDRLFFDEISENLHTSFVTSLMKDFRAGGVRALLVKVKRLDRAKLSILGRALSRFCLAQARRVWSFLRRRRSSSQTTKLEK